VASAQAEDFIRSSGIRVTLLAEPPRPGLLRYMLETSAEVETLDNAEARTA